MKGLVGILRRLHRCERGAEMIEKVLLVGFIVVPLLAFLIIARDWIMSWVSGEAESVITDGQNYNPNIGGS